MREKSRITWTDILISCLMAAGIVLVAALPRRLGIVFLVADSWKFSSLSVFLSFALLANVCRILVRRRKSPPILRIFLILLGLLAFLRLFQVTASVHARTAARAGNVYEADSLPIPAVGNDEGETLPDTRASAKTAAAAPGPYSASGPSRGK